MVLYEFLDHDAPVYYLDVEVDSHPLHYVCVSLVDIVPQDIS